MTCLTRTILLFLFCVLTVSALRNVTINKCCKSGEKPTKDFKCMISNTNKWNLAVYSSAKKIIAVRNNIPSNWIMNEGFIPNCKRTMLYPKSYVPFLNGSLWALEYERHFHPNSFCIDYDSAILCMPEEPQELNNLVKIYKCCGPDAIFHDTKMTCVPMKSDSYKIDVGPDKRLVGGFPHCETDQTRYVYRAKLNQADILSNGSLSLKESKTILPVGNYCLEHVMENASRYPTIFVCHETLGNSVTVEPADDLRFTLYPIGLAISAIFLAATLVAGSLLPSSHHVLHWRCQTYHVVCLLLGDVLLCITQLSGRMSPAPCFAIAVLMHFLFLAAFFWLNTMCFNIWWTFRDLRPQSNEKSQERCRLRIYELYAWGLPLVIASTAALLDKIPSNSDFLRPKFGKNNCWFYGTVEILTFFFGPIGVLLLVNLTLFALTARELTCGLWKRELVKSTSERAALGRVCLKLVVVMGVTWIADIVSWAVGGPHSLWYFTDLINCLQGVFIFIVVGCQPQVLSAVKRLWCLRKHRENRNGATTQHHSSSSQGNPSMGDTMTNSVTNTTKSIPLETTC